MLAVYLHIKCETGETSPVLRANKARAFYSADPESTAVLRVADTRVHHTVELGYHVVGDVVPGECPEELLDE